MPLRGSNLRLPAEAFNDFEILASGCEELEYLSRNSAFLRQAPSLDAAIEQISRREEAKALNLDRVWHALTALAVLRRSLSCSASEMLASISSSVDESAPDGWTQIHGAGWHQALPFLESLLDANGCMSLLEKSRLLAYSYSNVITGTQVITDIRPVIDSDATKIERVSVSFVLALDHHDGERHKRADFALDYADIEQLLAQCQRAQLKAKTIMSQLSRADHDMIVSVAGASSEIGPE